MSMSLAMMPLRAVGFVLPFIVCSIVAFAAHDDGQLAGTRGSRGDGVTALRQFESKVRPILEKHCIPCHGPTSAKAGLRLDTPQGYSTPGIVVAGKPAASLLVQRVKSSANPMPPVGNLSHAEIQSMESWVAAGAVDPRGSKSGGALQLGPRLRARPFRITSADRGWWAFQPLKSQKAQKSIDSLIEEHLTKSGLRMSPPATPRERVRRAYFDLWGIPPSPADVAAFEANPSATAWAALIDRLLESPRFGERWGRHWLDIVRFAETNGYERDSPKPFAWRYRDWVIKSINDDKPYDRFVMEQLAGDELPDGGDDGLIATGYYRLHVWDDEPDSTLAAEYDDFDDIMVTTGAAFLGLTIGCARCHDHKFDPISQRDYYSLLAFFRGIDPYGQHKTGGGGRGTGKILTQLRGLPNEQVLCAQENGTRPRETFVLVRGDVNAPAEKVNPAVPELFSDTGNVPPPVTTPASRTSSGQRTSLAAWIASPRNPLTSRVMVNRAWQHLFGRGIVATPDDFGVTGLRPSNQNLLDYLAARFVSGGWKLKPLLREIMLSRAYQQRSQNDQPRAHRIDPDNQYFWRQSLRRLEAEAIRDSLLSISGELNFKMYGPSVFPTLPPDVRDNGNPANAGWVDSPLDEQKRRSVYLVVKRALKVPFLEALDFANSTSPAGVRPVTTTAPQALMFLNDAFVQGRAAALAERITREAPSDVIGTLYEHVLQRKPTNAERLAMAKICRDTSRKEELIRCCRIMLNLNEVIYVD